MAPVTVVAEESGEGSEKEVLDPGDCDEEDAEAEAEAEAEVEAETEELSRKLAIGEESRDARVGGFLAPTSPPWPANLGPTAMEGTFSPEP